MSRHTGAGPASLLVALIGLAAGRAAPAAMQTVTASNGSCDAVGFVPNYVTRYVEGSGYVVDSVGLTGLDTAACAGRRLVLRLTDGDDTDLGQGLLTVQPGDRNPTVMLTGRPPAASVTGVRVFLEPAARSG
jgi:hypothetical protein